MTIAAAALNPLRRAVVIGVLGDIGTSPIYTFRECLKSSGNAGNEAVLGPLSLVFPHGHRHNQIRLLLGLASSALRTAALAGADRARGRRAVLWRRNDHSGDLGAERGRGARAAKLDEREVGVTTRKCSECTTSWTKHERAARWYVRSTHSVSEEVKGVITGGILVVSDHRIDAGCKGFHGEGLDHYLHAEFELDTPERGVLGVAGNEQHFQPG
jgi:hypothetical protein